MSACLSLPGERVEYESRQDTPQWVALAWAAYLPDNYPERDRLYRSRRCHKMAKSHRLRGRMGFSGFARQRPTRQMPQQVLRLPIVLGR